MGIFIAGNIPLKNILRSAQSGRYLLMKLDSSIQATLTLGSKNEPYSFNEERFAIVEMVPFEEGFMGKVHLTQKDESKAKIIFRNTLAIRLEQASAPLLGVRLGHADPDRSLAPYGDNQNMKAVFKA